MKLDLPELFAPARIVSGRMARDCSAQMDLNPRTVIPDMQFCGFAIIVFPSRPGIIILMLRIFEVEVCNIALPADLRRRS